jgi:tetratricopeptide (TPR) repeat protein
MKKIVLASVIALAIISLVSSPTLRAQDQSTITIKDPAEYNAYSQATTQADPKAKAAALESFVQTYPQSVVKQDVLKMLLETYQGLGDADHALSAASRLLQMDPGNMEAIFLSVAIKTQQCKKGLDPKTGFATDPQPCDDAAALAQKGLTAPKPAAVSADDWKKQTDTAYPVFHSAIAADDVYSKKDFKAAIDEYRKELMLFQPDQTKSGTGLVDTLNLAEAYAKLAPPDAVNAVWFYARAWNFAPAGFKAPIEKKLDYWYNKYHGGLDGLDAIKSQAAATVFPPGTLMIKPAATPAEKIHTILETTPDLTTLALADKELVLAYGAKEDAEKLWALMKDKETPVPGVVIDATASQIKMAVTDDAKQSKVPDFIVNMKEPIPEKEIPKAGDEFKLMSEGGPELDGTYDTYTQIPGTDTVPQSAQIVLRDAFIQAKKKPVARKPAAGHHTATH